LGVDLAAGIMAELAAAGFDKSNFAARVKLQSFHMPVRGPLLPLRVRFAWDVAPWGRRPPSLLKAVRWRARSPFDIAGLAANTLRTWST